MSSRHTPRHARLHMTEPAAPCPPPRASIPSPTFRRFAPGVGDDSDVRYTPSGGLSAMDLLITDSGPNPDKTAAMERGGMEVVRA